MANVFVVIEHHTHNEYINYIRGVYTNRVMAEAVADQYGRPHHRVIKFEVNENTDIVDSEYKPYQIIINGDGDVTLAQIVPARKLRRHFKKDNVSYYYFTTTSITDAVSAAQALAASGVPASGSSPFRNFGENRTFPSIE